MAKLLIVVSLIGSTYCCIMGIHKRIMGGHDAKPGEFPYQVSIQTPEFGHYCGASILSPTKILTAAHCLENPDSSYQIVAGVTKLNDTNPERQERTIIKSFIHPEYNRRQIINDIAVGELDEPLKFNKFIQTIDLPESGVDPKGKAVASGWGALNHEGDDYPDHLQTITVPILEVKECEKHFGNFRRDTQICSGPLDKGLCGGDSGSPLAQQGSIIALISYGLYPCASNAPTVQTKVSSYIDFIKKHL